MSSPAWIARLFARKAAPRRPARRPSYRPFVEGFEDRIVMSGEPVFAPALAPASPASPAAQGVSFDAHDAFHNDVNGQNNGTLDTSLIAFLITVVFLGVYSRYRYESLAVFVFPIVVFWPAPTVPVFGL